MIKTLITTVREFITRGVIGIIVGARIIGDVEGGGDGASKRAVTSPT
jgi:hypothetical protein